MSKRKRRNPLIRPRLFCINSMPRCGTWLLKTAIEQHPDVYCHGEIFNMYDPCSEPFLPYTVEQSMALLEKQHKAKRTGFCVHRNHETRAIETIRHKWAALRVPFSVPTIILYRINMLSQFVSLKRAEAAKQWQVYEEGERPEYPVLTIDRDELRRFFRKNRKLRFPPRIRWKRSIYVSYEQLVTHTEFAMKRVQEFLRIPVQPLAPTTVKTGIPLREAVANFDELRKSFEGSRWLKFFKNPE